MHAADCIYKTMETSRFCIPGGIILCLSMIDPTFDHCGGMESNAILGGYWRDCIGFQVPRPSRFATFQLKLSKPYNLDDVAFQNTLTKCGDGGVLWSIHIVIE